MARAGLVRAIAIAVVLLGGLLPPVAPAAARDGWLPTGRMLTPRTVHVAAPLPGGRILVAGGRAADGSSRSLAAAEIYEPATDRWAAAAPLGISREFATATTLRDGRVLVVGGYAQLRLSDALASAELYDPAADRWTAAAPLAGGRANHRAVLLTDGRVLIVAGRRAVAPDAELASAEIYDPVSDRWAPAGALATARARPATALLPDGGVLVVGGYQDRGTRDDPGTLATAERYDPRANAWHPAAPMARRRYEPVAASLPDGGVLVAGDGPTERYDPVADRWSPAGDQGFLAARVTATPLPDGRVLIVGGATRGRAGYDPVAAAVYDPLTDRLDPAAPTTGAHDFHTATPLPDGRVLVVGGLDGGAPTAVPAERYAADLPERRCFPETGHCVAGRFLGYWEAHGGLPSHGYPLGDEVVATLEDGRPYTVQYFERSRLESHPENAAPFDVLLGQFGRRFHPADPAADRRDGARYFEQTGHNLRGRFREYWEGHGGLLQFGYPLSEEFPERLEDGTTYTVQYFERARLELHPENPAPDDVLLGQFGRRILAEEAAKP